MKKYLYLLFIGLSLILRQTQAQNYPVLATPLLQPPYSLDLQDYQGPASKLKVQLLLRDLTKPSLEIYISLRLSGFGVEIQTNPAVATLHTFVLQPGVPLTISGSELSPLFAQLQAQGLKYEDLLAGVSLPGGYYTWEVVAYLPDGRQVSNTGRASMSVFKAQPPQITFPAHNASIAAAGITTIPFQWISRSVTPASVLGTIYDMKIYELPDEITDPNTAVLSGLLPVFNTQTASTSYFYGPGDPLLIPGRRYAVVVQAQDLAGGDSFENQGLSQVVAFKVSGEPDPTTQAACPAPTGLSIRPDDAQTLEVSWNPAAEAVDYLLQFRKSNEPWQSQVTTDNGLMLIQLSPAKYEVQVATRCTGGLLSNISPIATYDLMTEVESTQDEVEDPLTYYYEDEETPEPTEYEEPEEDDGLDILNTPFTILIDTDALPDSLKANLPSGGSLPVLPENPSIEQLKDAVKVKKTTCAAVIAGYTCGNHDAASPPSGDDYLPQPGDELAMNSIKIEVVEIDAAGNGLGIAHIKGFNNAKLGVEFKGIKVKEGGCIYAGEAITNSVDLALLNAKQRAALEKAYATYTAVLDKIEENAEGVAETFNSITDLYIMIAKKTQTLIDKISSGQKISQKEIKELDELKKHGAEKMNKSADYFLKSFGTEGSQPILDIIQSANESCICSLETEGVKKGPAIEELFINLEDCKNCLEEQKKKQEQAALLAKAFDKRYKSMKNKEMACGCLGWENFLQDISIIDGLTDCEEIVAIMNKAKTNLSTIGSADFSVNNLLFDENKPTGQVSIGNTCIDNFSIKAIPNSASIIVSADKKTQYNDPAVEIINKSITITDYSNPGSSLVIGTDNNEQAKLVEKWLFEKILNEAISNKKPGYTPPDGAVDVTLLDISNDGKETLSKHEGGCVLHVYNDYKGAKSDFCKEHFVLGKVAAEHNDTPKWISDKCEAQNHYAEIKRLSIKGYGNPTIGVGYMISNHVELEKYCIEKENKITKEECLELFSEKLPEYVGDLKAAIPDGSKLTQCQFDALVSIVYNRGIGTKKCSKGLGKCGFKSDELFKEIILEKKFNDSTAYDFIVNDHSKLKGSDRRKAEAELYTNCKY